MEPITIDLTKYGKLDMHRVHCELYRIYEDLNNCTNVLMHNLVYMNHMDNTPYVLSDSCRFPHTFYGFQLERTVSKRLIKGEFIFATEFLQSDGSVRYIVLSKERE